MERILGDGDFVMDVLSEANRRMDRRYELKSRGYTIEKLCRRHSYGEALKDEPTRAAYAIGRSERIVKDNNFQMIEQLLNYKWTLSAQKQGKVITYLILSGPHHHYERLSA